MLNSLYKSPIFSIVVYILTIFVIAVYLYYKYKNKRFFTIYNVSVYTSIFSYIVVTPFLFNDLAWAALGVTNARFFYPYLYESISINFIGFIIFLLSDMYFEKRHIDKVAGKKFSNVVEKCISYQAVCIVFIILSVIYLFIVFVFNGGFPLFSGGRTFFYDNGLISYIYQAVNTMITFSGLYLGLYYVNNKKGKLLFLWSVILSLSTGTRGSVILSVLYPTILMMIIKHYKKIKIRYIIFLVVILLILGMYLGVIRNGSKEQVDYFEQIFYGNNFSDIRDGAFLFYGYENYFNSEIIGGKTYLAGILSFIPSSLSEFRHDWSYGRFTTEVLFGLKNHFGLRGGNSFEPYINFRMMGVFLTSVFSGYFFANMEKSYTLNIYNKIKSGEKINVNSVFYANFLSAIWSFFFCSVNIRSIYVLIVYLIMIWSVKSLLSSKK